jgi:hypothetical protein
MMEPPTSAYKQLCLQLNIICLLLFLIGTAAIVEHPEWFR